MAVESELNRNFTAAFRRAMELYVGRGKAYSAEDIAEATGVCVNTLYAYKRGELSPSFATAMALVSVMDARFANKVLAPAGLTAHRIDEMDNDTHRVHAEAAGLVATMANMLRDGRFDHREKAQLRDTLPDIIKVMSDWLAAEEAVPNLRAVGDGE